MSESPTDFTPIREELERLGSLIVSLKSELRAQKVDLDRLAKHVGIDLNE